MAKYNSTDYEQSFTKFLMAARDGDIELVKSLLEAEPACIDDVNIDKSNALHLASQNDHELVVKFLLNKRPDLAYKLNDLKQNALHIASKHCHSVIVKLILNTNPPISFIDAKDCTDKTALMWAAKQGHVVTTKLLLEANPESAYILIENNMSALQSAIGYLHDKRRENIIKVFEDNAPFDYTIEVFSKLKGDFSIKAQQLTEKYISLSIEHLFSHLPKVLIKGVLEFIIDSKTIDLGKVQQFQYSLPNQPALIGTTTDFLLAPDLQTIIDDALDTTNQNHSQDPSIIDHSVVIYMGENIQEIDQVD